MQPRQLRTHQTRDASCWRVVAAGPVPLRPMGAGRVMCAHLDSDDEGDVPPLLNAPLTPPANQPVNAAKKAAQPAVTPPAANRPHEAGDLVTVNGLVSKPELNGREARITGYDEAKARFAVELLDAGTLLSLKGANLIASRQPASLLKAPSWWCHSSQPCPRSGPPGS